MMHTKSESDITSLAPSSPSRPVYYVQSPSRDSHDGDKSSSMHATPNYNSPMESPSHPSFGRHSRNSSASRFSGIFRSSSGRKGGRKRNDKGWPECNVIVEEGKPYKAEVIVKSLAVSNIYIGEGSDFTGVPTKMLTVNGSLRMNIYNPAAFFGIHVSSMPVNLVYSEITVATGQLKKYFQPRKSHRIVSVNLEGTKVPLYGAGSSLAPVSNNGIEVPLTLQFEIRTRGEVVGKLVKTRHRVQISCPLVVDSASTKPIKFKKGSCTYS
ncbi:hypothetical protein F0562_024672 [Nyssa sinensis]|uniref:Late embryogenesis abundant protein LEA-2 subgroup domain-containing protein n=1 Tax=Nyssa sinensis TaxID=561372 RepID=A0A5J5BCJ0_9ASTE|nr:hypothetical protein F0562_024672 [Nyssa sinensis]